MIFNIFQVSMSYFYGFIGVEVGISGTIDYLILYKLPFVVLMLWFTYTLYNILIGKRRA